MMRVDRLFQALGSSFSEVIQAAVARVGSLLFHRITGSLVDFRRLFYFSAPLISSRRWAAQEFRDGFTQLCRSRYMIISRAAALRGVKLGLPPRLRCFRVYHCSMRNTLQRGRCFLLLILRQFHEFPSISRAARRGLVPLRDLLIITHLLRVDLTGPRIIVFARGLILERSLKQLGEEARAAADIMIFTPRLVADFFLDYCARGEHISYVLMQ